MLGLEAAVMCLALNMYHEARNEGEEAMMAVAEVTLNRVEDSNFPNDVCSVVKQARKNPDGSVKLNACQFSWYCDGKSDKMYEAYWRHKAYEMAVDYLTGLETDMTDGATHYHADYVSPYWSTSFDKTTKVGSHIFYR